ncbi:chondroitinase-B domain-containing protein [Mariniflexile ostreae]|uniref:Chondroitinase-B domain-containing protein n=1 Tax=Mariniflexile ostreae TaxID=1520892 RepID=A0ABV5FF94_9FLAO
MSLVTKVVQSVFLFMAIGCHAQSGILNTIKVSNNSQLITAISEVKAGDCILLKSGEYKDVKLIMQNSGTAETPILIKAQTNGEVFFTGDVKIEIRGNYNIIEGIYFKNGKRKKTEWKSHGPGLVAIYGSYNRVTQCAFHAFDEIDSAYITTSLTEEGKVPQYCRIDHCSFTDKTTFDQVINLNNTLQKTLEGEPGIPMYHRVDHNYFSNPKKQGNAGGGIRIGYWRKDFGRCIIESNLFERQDSEPEIITSKSQENVFYNNTVKNCRGTLNFRHGDTQVAINNFFISTDTKHEYGGMFVWGSNHIIANNYFQLKTTIENRGNAALYLNAGIEGDEHALAFNIKILNNYFINTNGYAIDFQGLKDRRKERTEQLGKIFQLPHHITLSNNLFYTENKKDFSFFNYENLKNRNINWEQNVAFGSNLGMPKNKGVNQNKIEFTQTNGFFMPIKPFPPSTSKVNNIKGINLDFQYIINQGVRGMPLTRNEVGPKWLKQNPSTYAETGQISKEIKERLSKLENKI